MTIAPPRSSDETLAFVAPARLGDDFGVYIHVPFCAHICPYCDFNTYAGQSDRIPRYIEAIKRETTLSASLFAGRAAKTIFIGGGTPSQLETKQINEVIASANPALTSLLMQK